jgi:hypothetical protein
MIRFSLLSIILCICCTTINAQVIWSNSITGTNPNTGNPYVAGQVVDPDVTVSGIGRGSGISSDNANNRYNASGWTQNTSITNPNNPADYYYFTITPNPGYSLSLGSFTYTGQRSGTGPRSFAFRSSLDNFATNVGPANTNGRTIDLSASAFQNITSPITFRFYGYEADNGTGTYSINDFSFLGNAVVLPATFDKLTASFVGEQLVVNWNTLSEKANDHFGVEISADGEIFKEIGVVKTKAAKGDSPVELSYSFTMEGKEISLVTGSLLALFLAGFLKRSTQYRMIVVVTSTLLMTSCSKWDSTKKTDTAAKYFIRIAQVDVDGKKSYSKTVQVTYQ